MAADQDRPLSVEPPAQSNAPATDTDRDVRRAESSLARAERLVDRALAPEDELRETARALTLARWGLRRHDALRRQWPRQATMLVASTATVAYLTYRVLWTMNLASTPAAIFSLTLLAAEFYAGASLALYFFQVWRLVEPPLRPPTPGRTVDVFVTTYNEDVALLRGTLKACVEMDYPHSTYVLDDGARDDVRRLAESLGVQYISRTERTHAKAGNLNHAMRQTDGEFVVVLDADHVPYRHYLSRLIGYFDDPTLGFVQTPHTTYNLDNFLGRWKASAKLYWEDVRIFFEAVQLGKNRHGVACFCGSAAILRRKALEDAGLFATETITEDLHTGMRINAAGWKSIAVSEEMVAGLAPDDADTFASQRLRWGEGNLSVMAYDNPLTMKGLTLAGRLNHLASIGNWTLGPARLVLYLTPLVMLLTGIAPVADMSILYFAIVGCYLVSVLTAVKVASNGCGQLLGIELALMASFHLQLQALWRALFRRGRQKFVVTAKQRVVSRAFRCRLWPQAALVALCVVAVSWAASRIAFGLTDDYLGLIIGSGLAAYIAWLALTVLGRATRTRTGSTQWQHPACLAVDYTVEDTTKPAVSLEFNEDQCRLLTWEPVEPSSSLGIRFYSPVGQVLCRARVVTSSPLGRREPFVYLNDILFDGANPARRESESDALRTIAMRYVVPVVTLAHRAGRHGRWPSLETLSGGPGLPIPLSIDARLPNMPVQKSVALSPSGRGFFTTLEHACPIGHSVAVTLNTPLQPIVTEAEVRDVEAVRVGSDIVYQHDFEWRDRSRIRPLMSQIKRWANPVEQATSSLRSSRQPVARVVGAQLAACVLVALTVFIFGQVHRQDIMLAAGIHGSLDPADREEMTKALEVPSDLEKLPTDRLLRRYQAAEAVGKHVVAAKAARQLAVRIEKRRPAWMWTQARHLMQAGQYDAADAVFQEMLLGSLDRALSPGERAKLYVEAARAAVAVQDLDRAVEHFLKANTLTTTDPEQAEELLGVLIAAKRAKLALQVLGQMERSDRVLRRIVDVHEMADQTEKALPELEELLRLHPDDAYVVRRLAELAVVRGDYAAAMSYYKSLSNLDPNDEGIRKRLAEAIILQAREDVADGQFDSALARFKESFHLTPPSDSLQREYGGILAKAGRISEAIDAIEPLEDTDSRLMLASLLEMQGEYRRALRVLLDLEKTQALDDKADQSIVRLLLAEEEYDDAVDRLVEQMRKKPDDSWLQRKFVEAVAASNREDDLLRQALVELFHKYQASGFEGFDSNEFERLSDASRQLGLLDEARVALNMAVAEYPDQRRLRLRLAETLGELGRYDDAETHYRNLLAKRPQRR